MFLKTCLIITFLSASFLAVNAGPTIKNEEYSLHQKKCCDSENHCDYANCTPVHKLNKRASHSKKTYCENYASEALRKKCEKDIKEALVKHKCTDKPEKCFTDCKEGIKKASYEKISRCGTSGTTMYVCCMAKMGKKAFNGLSKRLFSSEDSTEKTVTDEHDKSNKNVRWNESTEADDSSENNDQTTENYDTSLSNESTTVDDEPTTAKPDDDDFYSKGELSREIFETETIEPTTKANKRITQSFRPYHESTTPRSNMPPMCRNTYGNLPCNLKQSCGTGYMFNPITSTCEDIDECAQRKHLCASWGVPHQCVNMPGTYNCVKNVPTYFEHEQLPKPEMPCNGDGNYHGCTQSRVVALPSEPRYKPLPRMVSFWESRGEPVYLQPNISPCYYNTYNTDYTYPVKYNCTERVPHYSERVPHYTEKIIPKKPDIQKMCPRGYTMDSRDNCIDIDECAYNNHTCSSQQTCRNTQGSYLCDCIPGFRRLASGGCEDRDECSESSHVCSSYATCINTVGSYYCECNEGFTQSSNSHLLCNDIDECATNGGRGQCDHRCINVWGSFICACNSGYTLRSDSRTCEDVNECDIDYRRCYGECENIPGSYRCTCPDGYKMDSDQIGCTDIDECATGILRCNENEVCQNIRGGAKCIPISCPDGYKMEAGDNPRCRRIPTRCRYYTGNCLMEAHENLDNKLPNLYSYYFLSMPSNISLPQERIFRTRGCSEHEHVSKYDLQLVDARAPMGVKKATIDTFLLHDSENGAAISLVKTIIGPQEIELELSTYHNGAAHLDVLNVAKITILVSKYDF